MFKKFSFWIWSVVLLQFATGAIHSVGLFVEAAPANETEKQLTALVDGYHMNAGMGFTPTYGNLFFALSSCFTLLCFLSAGINLYLWKKKVPLAVMKGVMGINAIIFAVCFGIMAAFTFLPPIVCTGLILVSCCAAYFTAKEKW